MNTLLRATSAAVSLVTSLVLSGCGGGGGGGDTVTPGPLPAPPVPTLTESLASADTQFTPLTTALRNDYSTDPDSVSLTDDFRVTSISSDGAGGWRVTYVLGGVEGMLHFGHGDKVAGEPGNFRIESEEGRDLWFWSRRSEHVDDDTEQRYTYLDHNDGNVRFGDVRDRFMLVWGNRTGTAGLPAGTALFRGGVYMRSQLKDNPGNSGRLDIAGGVRLIADFVSSTLEGGVTGIRFRRYDQDGNRSVWEAIPTSNRFVFENGRITGAQLMADLTGMDSGNNALLDTVLGFEGTVDGEFYGPAAEEMAAVVNAESVAHNRVLIGNFHGKRANPRTFDGARVPLSAGVERDYPARRVHVTDTATVTAIEGDGAGGFHVTYRVDGADQRVHLEASDFGSDPDFPSIYASEGENSPYVLFDLSDSFAISGSPEFDHFNAQGWVVVAYDANDDANVRIGTMVYGDRTEIADLPAGTASYTGRVYAFSYPSDNPSHSAEGHLRGSLTLMADFANRGVSGRIHGIETRDVRTDPYEASTGELAINNGAISGNEFTADVTGQLPPGSFDGDMSGQFFGPAAAEVGGVWSGEYTAPGDTVAVYGFIGGKKQ